MNNSHKRIILLLALLTLMTYVHGSERDYKSFFDKCEKSIPQISETVQGRYIEIADEVVTFQTLGDWALLLEPQNMRELKILKEKTKSESKFVRCVSCYAYAKFLRLNWLKSPSGISFTDGKYSLSSKKYLTLINFLKKTEKKKEKQLALYFKNRTK